MNDEIEGLDKTMIQSEIFVKDVDGLFFFLSRHILLILDGFVSDFLGLYITLSLITLFLDVNLSGFMRTFKLDLVESTKL